jgi:glycosyltransferase involved in cell wall biosynthesis/GT2 family glycosyltransferase
MTVPAIGMTREIRTKAGRERTRLCSPPMSLRRLRPGEALDPDRGEVVVCIPVFGARGLFEQCLRSVVQHTAAGTLVLVADDASPDPGIEAFTAAVADEPQTTVRLAYVRRTQNTGFVRNMNAAFAATAPADVVILNSDVVVAADWLERLSAAALSDALVATVSTLTNNGTILSVPHRNRPSAEPPHGLSLGEAAERVAAASLKLRPRIPTGIGHCLYIRRSALELAGTFDEAFSPGYGEEVDFSQRCLQRGLSHIVADDLYVFHRGAGTFGGAPATNQEAHERLLRERYPGYHRAVREAERSEALPLARALSAARLALGELTVTIDGASLGPHVTGTQLHTLELVGALARKGGARLRIRVPRTIGETARSALDALDVERFYTDEVDGISERSDVVHRPFQVVDPLDLTLLRRMGRRVVLTQQDLIAFHNPAYFDDYAAWHGYRELARQALAEADRVAFFSEHAAKESLAEDLVDAERARVVHIGVDHQTLPATHAPRVPERAPELAERPFLLCLGTDFLHKNRAFALAVFAALRSAHGYAGRFVLAGPHASSGTSAAEELDWRARDPAAAADVLDLGAVGEDEKEWLYANADLLLYPTVQEGFGLVPFEAAGAGLASLWAAHSSLAEVLPPEAAAIVAWDPAATAVNAARLLREPGEREALVAQVRAAGARFSWDVTATRMLAVYREAATAPARHASERPTALPDLAVSLVGPGGFVPPDVQQALLAVSTRPPLRRPVFAALRAGYRALYRARRMRSDGSGS